MSMTDPIADLLTRIRNAQMASHDTVSVPHSRMRESIVRILCDEGYLAGFHLREGERFKHLELELKYQKGRVPVIQQLRRVSTPGRRVYAGKDEIPQVLGGLGVNVLSTSQGVMTGKEARSKGIGGEILCEIL